MDIKAMMIIREFDSEGKMHESVFDRFMAVGMDDYAETATAIVNEMTQDEIMSGTAEFMNMVSEDLENLENVGGAAHE